jgi:hypothetical protein
MAWLISKALYEKWHSSLELEEESSEDTCSDGKQSAQSSGNPIQLAYLPPDKMTAFSRISRFGMTFKPLTESLGAELLMWFREDFLAKIYPQQAMEQELPEANPVCGNTWQGSLAKYNPDTLSWKIAQCSLFEDLELSWQTWPQWGLMRNGECWEQTPLGLVTIEKEYGYWPTPVATDWKATGKLETLKRQGDKNGAGHQNRPQYQYARKYNMKMPLAAQEILMKWPLGWTDLKPLVMDKSHCVQQQHGEF